MPDFDNEKYKKIVRKENIDSKKTKKDDYSDEYRFQRKKINNFKNRIRQMKEDELWEDWENEIP